MKFIVSSQALFKQLQTISGVLNSSNTLPILDNFLFEIKDNNLKLFSSSTLSLMSSLGRSVSKTEVVYYTRHALVFHSCLALTSAGDWRAVNLSPTLASNQVSVKLREK